MTFITKEAFLLMRVLFSCGHVWQKQYINYKTADISLPHINLCSSY